MNILLINHYAGSEKYGMEYRPYYLAREWVKLGHNVTIVGANFSHLRNKQPACREEIVDGIHYVWCGFIITVVPILIMGFIGRKIAKINYFTLMGLIAGSNTDPPALAFANQTAGNDAPAVGYSTVYPLSMFLRILTAQLIILLLCTL